MLKKVKQSLLRLCAILELLMGAIVAVGLIVCILCMFEPVQTLLTPFLPFSDLTGFLGSVAEIVIGIEFLKMLCEPQATTVIEVIIFLIARHMIIAETDALENLLAVISIAILFAIRKYLDQTFDH